MFDVMIFGGGVAGVSCALVLGSAKNKLFAANKTIAIVSHQKTSSLQEALFNNAYGIEPGKTGAQLLHDSLKHLDDMYPHVVQICGEKVFKIEGSAPQFTVYTNRNTYKTAIIIVAIGYADTFAIEGLMQYVMPHQKTNPEKRHVQLKNADHKVDNGIYVAGNLAGWRSQLSIASGSGASVATDILTLWNGDLHTQIHDSIKNK